MTSYISYLDDDDDVLEADVYITPPENFDKSDEDSGNEESTDINFVSAPVIGRSRT